MYQVRDMNWKASKYIRAGIIPVMYQNGIRFYGFSIDNEIGQIGDFGGHRESFDRDALDTAIREYEEESLNICGKITRDSIQDCYVLDGFDTIEILVPIPGSFYQLTTSFRHRIGSSTELEAQNIIWLSRGQVLRALDSQNEAIAGSKIYQMYYRIHNVLQRNRDYI